MSNNDIIVTGTPRSSGSSPKSTLWAPPKSPLPPHRLAKLANALGVSTPVHHYPNYPSTNLSPASLQLPESFRRSPSPSASSMTFSIHSPTTCKFLLHVIPPLTLPHDSEFIEKSNLTPPPPTASGYHTQFRRGTLVPMHSTLQAQLWAIAREYALPSITGIVLYLVSNPGAFLDEGLDEPGPRLSEEIWKHLWTRVRKAERDESLASPISPGVVGLGLGIGAHSTPHLLQEGSVSTSSGRSLKLLLSNGKSSDSPPSFGAPYPSPSTPSSASDTPIRDRYPIRSTSSQSFSSGTQSPDTSLLSDDQSVRANSLDLPGLNSPGIIPILAKVEFDIDRKKAGWYEPWLRSRKMNQVKRKKAVRSNSANSVESSAEIRVPPIALKLKGRAMTASPISMFERNGDGYEPLEDEDEDSDEDSNYDDDATARITSTDMRDQINVRRTKNGSVVDLTLTGGELSALPDQEEEGVGRKRDVEEVQEIMTTALHRKNLPPPLVLHTGMTSRELSIPSPQHSGNSSDSTALAYLKGETPINEVLFKPEEDELAGDDCRPLKSATESEKRVGAVFEDLDLGLDPSEDFDNSQYLFSEQLDEIERNLVQLSPRALKVDLDSPQNLGIVNEQFLNLPPGAVRNSDVLPPSPRKDTFDVDIENTTDPSRTSEEKATAPVLAVNGVTTTASPPRKASLSVGLLLPKRVDSEESPIIPLSPDPFGRYPSSPPQPPLTNSSRNSNAYWDSVPVGLATGSLKKHRESVSTTGKPETRPRSTKSSRFSTDSTNEDGEDVQVKGKGGVSMKSIKRLWRKSNKNSVASVSSLPPPPPTPTITAAPLIPTAQQQLGSKSTPELSLNSPMDPHFRYPSPTARSASPNQPPVRPPIRPPRPSREEIEFPDIPDQLTIPLQPASGRPAPMPILAAQMIHGGRSQDSGLDRLHFDQESPYPTTKRKGSSRPVSPTSVASQPSPTPPPPPPFPENANGNGVNASNKTSIRKSILKWKSSTQLGESGRPRKSSTASLSSKSPSSGYLENIPPSPNIPEYFLQSRPSQASSHSHSSIDSRTDSLRFMPPRTSNSSATSTASPPPRTSKDSIPSSLDDSQFEIISPKVGSLSYPYHNLEA